MRGTPLFTSLLNPVVVDMCLGLEHQWRADPSCPLFSLGWEVFTGDPPGCMNRNQVIVMLRSPEIPKFSGKYVASANGNSLL